MEKHFCKFLNINKEKKGVSLQSGSLIKYKPIMVYNINYDIKDANRRIAFVSKAKGFGDLELYIPTAFFLDSTWSCDEIYNELRSCLGTSDLFFIARVDPKDRNGWLNTKTVGWLTEKERLKN